METRNGYQKAFVAQSAERVTVTIKFIVITRSLVRFQPRAFECLYKHF